MVRVRDLLQADRLPDSTSARLDVELLLSSVLNRPRSYLHTWPEYELSPEELSGFHAILARRRCGEPMAYILGRCGFWSMNLMVNEHTLIPRPETELLVEAALQRQVHDSAEILDLGTGSGALALALALERPGWRVSAVDCSEATLQVAESNRREQGLSNLQLIQSDWFSALENQHFHLIVSNPPYVAEGDLHLKQGDVRFEPLTALASGQDGLDDIRHIATHSPEHLRLGGWLLLEHGWNQGQAVRELLQESGLSVVESLRDLAGHERITLGCLL